MSEINRVNARLQHIKFIRQFEEHVNDIKPGIVSATAAMQDILKSKR